MVNSSEMPGRPEAPSSFAASGEQGMDKKRKAKITNGAHMYARLFLNASLDSKSAALIEDPNKVLEPFAFGQHSIDAAVRLAKTELGLQDSEEKFFIDAFKVACRKAVDPASSTVN